jgi:hypothetical protein
MNVYIGDTPEQLGRIEATSAMIVDGKVVTKVDYLTLVVLVEELRSQNAELITLIHKLDNENLMHTLRVKAAMNGYQPISIAPSPPPRDE